MAKQNAQRPSDMQNLVNGFNQMMEDPKQYANTVYKNRLVIKVVLGVEHVMLVLRLTNLGTRMVFPFNLSLIVILQ